MYEIAAGDAGTTTDLLDPRTNEMSFQIDHESPGSGRPATPSRSYRRRASTMGSLATLPSRNRLEAMKLSRSTPAGSRPGQMPTSTNVLFVAPETWAECSPGQLHWVIFVRARIQRSNVKNASTAT